MLQVTIAKRMRSGLNRGRTTGCRTGCTPGARDEPCCSEAREVAARETARRLNHASLGVRCLRASIPGRTRRIWTDDRTLPMTTYLDLLARLHAALQPQVYLEIGVEGGAALALSRSESIAIRTGAAAW